MRKFLVACALAAAFAVSGCAQWNDFTSKVESAYTAVTEFKVSYKYALASVAAYNTVQDTAAQYLRLPTCTASSGPVCHDRRATAPLRAVMQSGRVSRNAVLNYMASNPCDAAGQCPLMPQGLVDTLKNATDVVQSTYDTYKKGLGG